MTKEPRLTVISLVLVAGALAIPSVSWYFVGWQDAERRADSLERETWRRAQETARQLVDRVRVRLEGLREAESRRPFYHYQSLYHDPKGASEGLSVVPSPLAMGPTDPIVLAHFQVDASGKLTMPTLNEDALDEMSLAEIAIERAIQAELAPLIPVCTALIREERPPPIESQQQGKVALRQKVELLQPEAYQQNIDAQKLYADIKGGKRVQVEPRPAAAQQKDSLVRVGVDDFQWKTVLMENNPTLVALRRVTTPGGVLAQGFVVDASAVEEYFKGAAFPSRFRRFGASHENEIGMVVAPTDWRVLVDATRAITSAQKEAEGVRTRFIKFFLASLTFAGIAGLCVVGLVWQMERLARERSQFAASAAHELRTPLAGLRIYSEMLAEGLGDPARAKEYARRVASEAERLGRVVANVLGFTRIERGTLKVHPVMGDLATAVRDSVARQQPALEAAGARVSLHISDGLPAVRFDRDAVGEIVQNLLDNAEKHTRSANDRTIHVSLDQERALNGAGAKLVLSVTDHGPGLPSEVRRNLFRPFTRGKNNDAPAGLGLGLVLVQALSQAQGGQVTYRDANGGGAVFSVSFPA
jgi:signal transduction histidine kinase